MKKIGSIGGHARAKALSPEQRASIAKKAAEARWGTSREGIPEAWIWSFARDFVYRSIRTPNQHDRMTMPWPASAHKRVMSEVRRLKEKYDPERRAKERREAERRKTERRTKVDEASPLQRTPEIRRLNTKRRYYSRRTQP